MQASYQTPGAARIILICMDKTREAGSDVDSRPVDCKECRHGRHPWVLLLTPVGWHRWPPAIFPPAALANALGRQALCPWVLPRATPRPCPERRNDHHVGPLERLRIRHNPPISRSADDVARCCSHRRHPRSLFALERTRNATEVSAATRRPGQPGLTSSFPEPALFAAAR